MNTAKSRIFAGSSVIIGCLIMAFGCGGDEGVQGDTITYWATNEGPSVEADQEILNEAIGEFEEQSGVEVEIQVIPWDSLYQRILTATTSGEGPDVLNIGNTWSAALQATGAFLPFEEEAMEAIGGMDKFAEAPMRSTGAAGETPTSVPLYSVPDAGLFYNLSMFEEAGIEGAPETWEELVEAGEQLTQDTNNDGQMDQWGMAIAGGSNIDNIHRGFVLSRQQGGAFFDGEGQPTFASPENVEAVKTYVDLVAEHEIAAPASAETDGTQVVSQFANGNAAMMLGPIGTINNLESRGMSEDEFGVALTPVPDPLPPGGEPVRGYVSGSNISIFANTDNEEVALDFVGFMTEPEQQLQVTQEYGNFPVVEEALQDPAYQGGKLDVFQEVLENSAPMPQVPQEGEMETLVGDAMVSLFAQAATSGAVTEQDVRDELRAANERLEASAGVAQ